MNQLLNALVIPARLNHPVHIRPLQLDAASRQRVAAGKLRCWQERTGAPT